MKTPFADFPDWLGPMLVKELRQGLKARGFVFSFLGFQVVLAIVLIYHVLLYAREGKGFEVGGLSATFWTLIGAQLLLITPLRALNELAGERKANTLELIFMSGLTAWRIIFGKWISLLFQALLFLLAILPYMILRYYFGGVNLTEDLTVLGTIMLACALVSAVALAISGLALFARVTAAVLASLLVLSWVPMMLARMAFGGRSGAMSFFDFSDVNFWFIALDSLLVCLIALEVGAATVAPVAENHVGRQRFLALLAFLPVPWLQALHTTEAGVMAQIVFFAVLAGVLSWHHLSDAPRSLLSYSRPFSGIRALLGLPFQPGWPSAVVFLTLAAALMGSANLGKLWSSESESWFMAACWMAGASLLCSTLAWVVLRRRARRPLIEQTIFLILCGSSVALLEAGVPHSTHLGQLPWLGALPPVALFSMADVDGSVGWRGHTPSAGEWSYLWLTVSGAAFGAYALVLLTISHRYWVQYFRDCFRSVLKPVLTAPVALSDKGAALLP